MLIIQNFSWGSNAQRCKFHFNFWEEGRGAGALRQIARIADLNSDNGYIANNLEVEQDASTEAAEVFLP